MGEWRQFTLDELYEFASGLSKPRSEFGRGYPFLSFKNVFYNYFVPRNLESLVRSDYDKERSRCSVRRGDVFLTRTSETMNELGMSCVALRDIPDATFNGFTKRLRPKSEGIVLPEYAGYFFRSATFREEVTSMTTMSTRASLNNEMLARLTMTVPPANVQSAIGGILLALDDKIELNRRMNETLEAMARAIFKDWFVDFGPTRAKAEGRAPYLAPELWDLFPDTLDDEGKPVGWELGTLGDVATVKSGKRPPTKLKVPDGAHEVPVYGGNGVSWYTNKMLYDPPFLITGRVGTLGTVFRVFDRVWVSDNALCCFPTEREYLELLFFHLKSLNYDSLNSGSTQPLLTQTALVAQKIVLGEQSIRDAFSSGIRPMFSRIVHNTRENQILVSVRDFLLPKLMSGEIRLRDAEHLVGAVT